MTGPVPVCVFVPWARCPRCRALIHGYRIDVVHDAAYLQPCGDRAPDRVSWSRTERFV